MDRNDKQRQKWVKKTIVALPKGRILDAGAGELQQFRKLLQYGICISRSLSI